MKNLPILTNFKIVRHYFLSLLALLFAITLSGNCQTNPFEKEILAFEKSDSIRMPLKNANLFIGSSSIRLWESLSYDFPQKSTINRGFGGSNLVDLAFFADRIIEKYEPAKIFIYSGENDIAAGATAQQTFERFQIVFEKIRNTMPIVPILFISIKPSPSRWNQFATQNEANNLIKSYLDSKPNAEFVSIVNKMLQRGKPNPSIFIGDKLHMNKKGYEIWTKKLKRYVVY
jgi:lysophospholipase L1-like esterase